MYGRALIPILDKDNVLGVSGRSVYDWHPKYLHSKGLQTGNLLFNYENATSFIADSKTAILVESPMNCLRLIEAGVYNSVALFGLNFSTEKQLLLDTLGVTDITLILDSDKAGKRGSDKIIKDCSICYNIKNIQLEGYKDIADISVTHLKGLYKTW